jgi:hypothetical protein
MKEKVREGKKGRKAGERMNVLIHGCRIMCVHSSVPFYLLVGVALNVAQHSGQWQRKCASKLKVLGKGLLHSL